jgi:hypothetical protein
MFFRHKTKRSCFSHNAKKSLRLLNLAITFCELGTFRREVDTLADQQEGLRSVQGLFPSGSALNRVWTIVVQVFIWSSMHLLLQSAICHIHILHEEILLRWKSRCKVFSRARQDCSRSCGVPAEVV